MVISAEQLADPALAIDHSRYLSNLAALYSRIPALAAEIDRIPFSAAPQLVGTRDGSPTVSVRADDGRALFLHSRYQPRDEARDLVAGLPECANPTFIVCGVGLGYVVTELEKRWTRPILVLAESDLSLLKAAFCVTDFSRALREKRVMILTAADRAAVHAQLNAGNADLLLGMQFVVAPHAQRCRAAFHEQLRANLLDWVSYSRMQVVTLLKTNRTTFRNVAFAIPHLLSEPGVETLKNKAAGRPAILISAGPSLAKSMGMLARLRERAVLIAVQTVYKPLLASGVRPHFVTSLDFHEISAEFFRDVRGAGDCLLVAEPKAAPGVLDHFPGQRRILRHKFMDLLLRDAMPRRGALPAGATVAHLAFYLAEHLGCDPILFVGQDLAFTDGLFYMPGSPIERIWAPEMGRYQTVEMKQWDRIVRNRGILRQTRDMRGGPVYTDDLLFTYREQFQRDFTRSTRRLVQISGGGAALEGMELMSLDEAAEQFCTQPLEPAWLGGSDDSAASFARAIDELEKRRAEVRRVREIAAETLRLLSGLDSLIERPAEFNRRVSQIEGLRAELDRYPHIYSLVIEVSTTAELRRHSADRKISRDAEGNSVEGARRRLIRDREFVASFLEGCEYLESVLPEVVERVRERAT